MLRSVIERAAPGSYCFTIARTRHFDEALLAGVRAGVKQVVILGAGYDFAAFRFKDQLAGVRVFELDHPGTQARKLQLLMHGNAEIPTNVTYVGIDFAKQSFRKLLPRYGFRNDVKTLFLWEGVSYYLPLQAVDDVLKFVAGCAPGSSVVFDYALQSFVDGDTRHLRRRADRPLAEEDRRAVPVRPSPRRCPALPRQARAARRLARRTFRSGADVPHDTGQSPARAHIGPRAHHRGADLNGFDGANQWPRSPPKYRIRIPASSTRTCAAPHRLVGPVVPHRRE